MMLHGASPRLDGGLSQYMTLRADLPLQLEHAPGRQRPESPCGVTALPRASPAAEGQTAVLLPQRGGCPGTCSARPAALQLVGLTGKRSTVRWRVDVAGGRAHAGAHAGNPTRHCCGVRAPPGSTDAPPLCFVSIADRGLWTEKQEVESEFRTTPVSCCESQLNSHCHGKIGSTSTSAIHCFLPVLWELTLFVSLFCC